MTQQTKLIVWIAVPVVVIALLVGAFFIIRSQNSDRNEGTSAQEDRPSERDNGKNNQQSGQQATNKMPDFKSQYDSTCDAKANPNFTHSPLALDKMDNIQPLGAMLDGHVTPVDHVYVAPLDQNAPDNTYDVVMPADGRLIDVGRMPAQYIGDRTGVQLAPDDFRMVISFSCRYYAIFIHVHKLSDAVAKAVGTVNPGETKRISLEMKAGDLLAHLGGSTFDWTMVDTQSKLTGFVSPDLYSSESWKIYTIDPLSIYTGELKTKLQAKSLRTTEPFGGKIDWDVKGALRGSWFKQGTNGYQGASPERYWDGHLAIAPNNIDPTGTIYSTGNWAGKASQYVVKGDFKPESITAASGVTKIELIPVSYTQADGKPFTGGVLKRAMTLDKTEGKVVGTVLLQVMSGEKLKVEQFPGKIAADVTDFTAAAATYER